MALEQGDPRLGNNRPSLRLVPDLAPEISESEPSLPELFAEVSHEANTFLDEYKAKLLKEAYATGDEEMLINMFVTSSISGLDYDTQYNPEKGLWGRIADNMRVPRERFPDGVPASFGGGIVAIETYQEAWVDNKYVKLGIEQFIVIPPERSRRIFCGGRFWPDGMIVIPGEHDLDDPKTLILTTDAQGPSRLMHGTNGDIVLGQPCTDEDQIRSMLKTTKQIVESAKLKMTSQG